MIAKMYSDFIFELEIFAFHFGHTVNLKFHILIKSCS